MPTLNPTPGEVREQGPREVHPFRFVDQTADPNVSNFGPTVEKLDRPIASEPKPLVTSEADAPGSDPARPEVTEEQVPDAERVLEETAEPEAQEAEVEEQKRPLDPEIM